MILRGRGGKGRGWQTRRACVSVARWSRTVVARAPVTTERVARVLMADSSKEATPGVQLTPQQLASLSADVARNLKPAVIEEVERQKRAELPPDVIGLASRVERVYVNTVAEGEQKILLHLLEKARRPGLPRERGSGISTGAPGSSWHRSRGC